MNTLRSTDTAELFGRSSVEQFFDEHLRVVLPWPRAHAPKGERVVQAADIAALLAGAPHVEDVDPRGLYATQNWLVGQHARYYTTDVWERTGTTSADRDQHANRYPLIHVDEQGRHIILAGHHRSLVALLDGRPVRARVLRTGPTPVAVLPSLFVGTISHLDDHVATADPGAAAATIDAGQTAVVPDIDVAIATMKRLGLDPSTIDDRCRVAGFAFARGFEPHHDASQRNAEQVTGR